MTALANKHKAVNLAQGFPGFGADPELLRLIQKYTQEGFNQYAPMGGVLSLKVKISNKIINAGGREYHPENEIIITAGATQGIYSAMSAVVNPNDEVIVFDPSYDSYVPSIILNGGIPVRLELQKGDYSINWEKVKEKVNSRTKAIVINSPHNPTGTVWKESDLQTLKSIVAGTDIVILSDEVYEHMVFDGRKHLSITSDPVLSERAFVVYSFGKTFHITGWRTGYIVAPKHLMDEFVKCHQFQAYAVNTPVQHAICDYLDNENKYLELNKFFEQKRDFFLSCMKDSRFKPVLSEGTYFNLMDYSEISNESDTSFANWLTIEKKVAAIPLSVFYDNKRQDKVLRFCFAKSNDELELAAERLCKV